MSAESDGFDLRIRKPSAFEKEEDDNMNLRYYERRDDGVEVNLSTPHGSRAKLVRHSFTSL